MGSRPSSPLGSGENTGGGTGDRSKINRLRRRIEQIEKNALSREESISKLGDLTDGISGVFVLYAPASPTPDRPLASNIEGTPGSVSWTGDGDWSTGAGEDTVYMAQSIYEDGAWGPFQRTAIQGPAGRDAVNYAVQTPEGNQLKNSEGRLLVQGRRTEGPESGIIEASSGFSMRTQSGQEIGSLESNLGVPAQEEGLSFYLDDSDIGERTVVVLEGPDSQVKASATLTDLTEPVTGTLKIESGPVEYRKPDGGNWQTGITTLRAQFRRGGSVVADDTISVEWDGSSFAVVSGGASQNVQFDANERERSIELAAKYTLPNGGIEEEVKVIRAIKDGEAGEANVQYQIRPTNGRTLKNSEGELGLELVRVDGTEQTTVTSGPIQLHVQNQSGEYVPLRDRFDLDNYAPSIPASDIAQDLTVYAADRTGDAPTESNGDILDSVSLTDLTESVVGIVSLESGKFSYYRDPKKNWQTGTTTLKGEFFQGTNLKARSYVDVIWDAGPDGNHSFSVTKQPTDQSGYVNADQITISTKVGEDFGEEGQIIDVSFEYTFIPASSVPTSADLTGIPATEVTNGSTWFVIEDGSYWALDTNTSSIESGEMGWDPDGNGQINGVWYDTGEKSVTVTETKSIFAVASGSSGSRRYIRPTNGTFISSDNSTKNLGLEIIRSTGGVEEKITSGPVKLHYQDESGSFRLLSDLDPDLSNYAPQAISIDEIADGNLDVFLRDTGNQTTIDSISLADVTDQFTSTIEVLNGQTVLTKPGDETWGEQESSDLQVSLIGRVFQGGSEVASDARRVSFDGNAFSILDISDPSEVNPSDLSVNFSEGGTSAEVSYKYSPPGSAVEENVSETIVASSGGITTVDQFMRSKDGTVIKNASGEIELQIIEQEGNQERLLASGGGEGYKIRTDETSSGNGYAALGSSDSSLPEANPYAPTLGPNQIDGQLTLYLGTSTAESSIVDTISLADVQDPLSAGYVDPTALEATHFNGPSHGLVDPSEITFAGKYYDTQENEHVHEIQFSLSDDSEGNLSVQWNDGTNLTGARSNPDLDYIIRAQGTVLHDSTDPNNYSLPGSIDASDPAGADGVSGPVKELLVEFTGTDPNTGGTVSFVEQLQLLRDDGIYRIDPQNGTDIKRGSNSTLAFKFKRFDGNDANTLVDLEDGELNLVQVSGVDGSEVKRWPDDVSSSVVGEVTLGVEDIEAQDVLQLKTDPGSGSAALLDSKRIVDLNENFNAHYIEAPDGRKVTHYTVDEAPEAQGPPIDPQDLTFTGVFVPPGESRPTRRQDLHFEFQEGPNGNLVISSIFDDTADNGVENASGQVDVQVYNESGTLVFNSTGGTNKAGSAEVTDPARMRVLFSMTDDTDPDATGQSTQVEEHVEFVDDVSDIYFDVLDDGKDIRNGTGTVRFDVRKRDGNGDRRLTKGEIDGSSSATFNVVLKPTDTTSEAIDGGSGRMADGSGERPSGRIVLDQTDIDGDDTLRVRDGTAVLHSINILDVLDGTDGSDAVDIELTRIPKNLTYRWDKESESWSRTTDTKIEADVYHGPKLEATGEAVVAFDQTDGTLSKKSASAETGLTVSVNLGPESRAARIRFEYDHDPEKAVDTQGALSGLTQKEAGGGIRYYVEGTSSFWELDGSRSSPASSEVGWDPDEDGNYEGVWADTGVDSIYENVAVVEVTREGENAEKFNVLLEQGNLIKNSDGALRIEARRGEGKTESRLTDNGYRLANGNGTIIDETYPSGTVSQLGQAEDLYYELNAGAIDSSTDVFLRRYDGSLGETVASATLADLTESLVPVIDYSGPRAYHQGSKGDWETGETVITAEFYQGPGPDPIASAESHVTWNGPNSGGWTVEEDPTGTNAGSGIPISAISVTEKTYSVELTFAYTNSAGITQQATASVSALPAGEPGEFTSYIFQRSASNPGRPSASSGGTYVSPTPPSGWSDAPPSGGQKLWMAHAVYRIGDGGPALTIDTTGDGNPDEAWSAPKQLDSRTDVYRAWHPGNGTEPGASDPESEGITEPVVPSTVPSGRPGDGVTWTPDNGWKKTPSGVTSRDPYYMAVSRYDDQAGSNGSGGWLDWEISRVKGEKGEASQYHYIKPLNGRVIRNGSGSLELQVVSVIANDEQNVSGPSSLELQKQDTTGTWVALANPYNPTLGEPDITDGELLLRLRDTSAQTTVDTVRLADVTDGVGTGFVETPQGTEVTYFTDGTPNVEDNFVRPNPVTFRGVFVPATEPPADTAVTISASKNGPKIDASWSSTGGSEAKDLNGVSVTDKNGDPVTEGQTYTDPKAWTVSFAHTDPASGAPVPGFQETAYFNRDFARYSIEDPDDQTFKISADGTSVSPQNLTFKGKKDSRDEEKIVALDGSPYRFELYDDTDGTASVIYSSGYGGGSSAAAGAVQTDGSGSDKIEVNHTDIAGSGELRLKKGAATVETIRLVDQREGTDGDDAPNLDIELEKGVRQWIYDNDKNDWVPGVNDGTNRETHLVATFYKGASEKATATAKLRLNETKEKIEKVSSGGDMSVSVSGLGESLPARTAEATFTYEDTSESKRWEGDFQYSEGDVVYYPDAPDGGANAGHYIATVSSTTAGQPPDDTSEWAAHTKTYTETVQVSAVREGQNASAVFLTSDAEHFTLKGNGDYTPDPNGDSVGEIDVTAKAQNIPEGNRDWSWTVNGTSQSNSTNVQRVTSGDLSGGEVNITVTEESTGLEDKKRIQLLEDGTSGLTVVIAGSFHEYQTTPAGDIDGSLDDGNAKLRVYQGSTQLPIQEVVSTTVTPSDLTVSATTQSSGDYVLLSPTGHTTPFEGADVEVEMKVEVASGGSTETISGFVRYDAQDTVVIGATERAAAAEDLGDTFGGMALSQAAMGYLVPLSESPDQSKRWRSYLSKTGDLYLNDDNDNEAFEFRAEWDKTGDGQKQSDGVLAVGDVQEAKSFFSGIDFSTKDVPPNGFFGYHNGLIALNGEVSGTVGNTLELGNVPVNGIELDGNSSELRMYSGGDGTEDDWALAIGPDVSKPGSPREKLDNARSVSFTDAAVDFGTLNYSDTNIFGSTEISSVTTTGPPVEGVPIEANIGSVSVTGDPAINSNVEATKLDIELVADNEVLDAYNLIAAKSEDGTLSFSSPGPDTKSFESANLVGVVPVNTSSVYLRASWSVSKNWSSLNFTLDNVDIGQYKPKIVINDDGVFGRFGPNSLGTLQVGGGGGVGGGSANVRGVDSLQRSDMTEVVDNQLATTVPGTPPADQLIMQHVFHDRFDIGEALVYANSLPSSTPYSIVLDIDGTSQTLDFGSSNPQAFSLNESVSRNSVLRVVAPSTKDDSVSDLTISFDMDLVSA